MGVVMERRKDLQELGDGQSLFQQGVGQRVDIFLFHGGGGSTLLQGVTHSPCLHHQTQDHGASAGKVVPPGLETVIADHIGGLGGVKISVGGGDGSQLGGGVLQTAGVGQISPQVALPGLNIFFQ